MEICDLTLHSDSMHKDFDLSVYGTAGVPVIVFPEGDSSRTCWENNGMVDAVADLVDAGKVQLFCTDSADDMGWYATSSTAGYRLENLTAFFGFVDEVLVPYVREHAAVDALPVLAGAGSGALDATICMLRWPAEFAGLLALSGTYDARRYVGDLFTDEWAGVSPVDLADALGEDDAAFAGKQLAFVCGTSGTERGLETQRELQEVLGRKDVTATFEYWGQDVTYDWVWWQKEVAQLLPSVVVEGGLEERAHSARVGQAQAVADHTAAVLAAAKDELKNANAALKAARATDKSATARVKSETASVESAQAREAELSAKAAEAWAERDRIAALLAEAQAAGEKAQGAADAARHGRETAEWILGEAEASARKAAGALVDAKVRATNAKTAAKDAEKADADAKAALEAAKA